MTRTTTTATPRHINGRSTAIPSRQSSAAALKLAFEQLTHANSLEEIKDIRDQAEAIRLYTRCARAGLELQNRAAELKLRAERRAGKLLQSMALRGGDRKSNSKEGRLSLDDLGISTSQSWRWQKEASVPEEVFAKFVNAACAGHTELTTAALLRVAAAFLKKHNGAADAPMPPIKDVLPGGVNAIDCWRSIVTESVNHCRTLNTILAPLYDGDNPPELDLAQRRYLRQLVGNLLTLLTELRKHDPHVGPDTGLRAANEIQKERSEEPC